MRLGLTWIEAATVIVSTVAVYLAFLILIRIVGQRALAAMSSFDFAAAIALGALMGRTVLGATPTCWPAWRAWAPCSRSKQRSGWSAATGAWTMP
jgi:uncharacterized membrane protein YcaP (DUF421 family)